MKCTLVDHLPKLAVKRQNPTKPGRKPGSTAQEQKQTPLTKKEFKMQYM